ncbi:MAG TPA: hypothetical protein VG406_15395 [Isosphaeraceae bacterium]|nr:hypothetical protein [Isosphaeraceae bacterium]
MSVHDPDLDGAGPKAKPGFIWFTRSRWDRIFLPGVLASLALSLISAWMTGLSRFLLAGLGGSAMLSAFWLVSRRSTPPEGKAIQTVRGTPGMVPLLAWLGTCAALAIGGIEMIDHWFPLSRRGPPRTFGDRLMIGYAVGILALMVTGASLIERRFRRKSS